MSFEIKKIGDGPKQKTIDFLPRKKSVIKPIRQKRKFIYKKRYLILLPFLLFSLYFIFSFLLSVYDYSSNQTFLSRFFSPIMAELERDEQGFINVLLVGHGGGNHDGPDLTDTMILASLDPEKKTVVMMSVPRDFWVNTKRFGSSRINEVYRNIKLQLVNYYNIDEETASSEAMRILMTEISKILNKQIPYYARINFKGFTQLVDALDGIELEVEKDIYDASYPDGNWGTEIFSVKRGRHVFDGSTALKYARSRHDSSDFDRARRQQQVIQAIKDKVINTGVIESPRRISNLYSVFAKNFKTNFSSRELITLAIVASEVQKDSMRLAVLNDDWTSLGGFLGTPPRADYGGAFVLIPYSGDGDYSRIHIFSDLMFNYRDVLSSPIEVLNGTKRSGLAARAAERLERYGFEIGGIANSRDDKVYENTELWVYRDYERFSQLALQVNEILPVKLVDKTGYYEETDVVASFIIGQDYR